jgi:hypothetical protein
VLPIPEEIRMLADAYPCTLIIFIAPVLALPDCLQVYRVHGENSYQVDESMIPVEVKKNRLRLWELVVNAMEKWVAQNRCRGNEKFSKLFLDYWRLHLASQRFSVQHPGRIRFFCFKVKENYLCSVGQGWKLRTFNYISIALALIYGHERWEEAYKLRCKILERTTEWFRWFRGRRILDSGKV